METRPPIVPHVPSSEALFRFQVVSQVLTRVFHGHSKRQAIRQVVAERHVSISGALRKVSARTLSRWLVRFQADGLAGLEPRPRPACKSSHILPVKFLDFMIAEKKKDPAISVPDLIHLAREQGVLKPWDSVNRTTAYRACRRMGLSLARRKQPHDGDTRRFAFPHRMQMVLCDGKYFRAGASRAKRVALFFLDDATRFGLHVVVGTSETQVLFLRGLYELMTRYGYMDGLYLDNGAGFIGGDTLHVVAQLRVPLIHGTKAYPQGHGKIERFNRTTKKATLRKWDGRPDIDPDCGALELRLQHYLGEVYNRRPHASLDFQTPHERFFSDTRELNFPPGMEDLDHEFILLPERLVSRDHIVSLDSVHYEVPKGYANTKVHLQKNMLNGQIGFLHQDRTIQLHPVDLARNARARRGRGEARHDEDEARPLGKSASDLAFEHDFTPIVDPDGGFSDHT